MLQESTTQQWDPIYIDRDPGIGFKIYLFFLLAACVVTLFNLVRVWRAVLPFSTKRPAAESAYVRLLHVSSSRLACWMSLIFLAWGFLTSTRLYHMCTSMLMEKTTGRASILLAIQDSTSTLSMALVVVLLLYLARWHMVARIEGLRD